MNTVPRRSLIERTVMGLISRGYEIAEIAARWGVSVVDILRTITLREGKAADETIAPHPSEAE